MSGGAEFVITSYSIHYTKLYEWAPRVPVPPVISAVLSRSMPCGTRSTALPTSFAWLRSRSASRARLV
ncbi:hypothetical protein [Streptomyces cyaneogriseus]|uniref:hypothetical protein n=1 Tax=Streptomyces cyaneogriseus TaxID=68192 RepID=UPI001331A8A7|nr:hypothetical protein [Streptomyces cyaneogriseus]